MVRWYYNNIIHKLFGVSARGVHVSARLSNGTPHGVKNFSNIETLTTFALFVTLPNHCELIARLNDNICF